MSEEIRGSSILILGYGREGRSVHQYLLKRHPGLRIGVADRASVQLIAEAPSNTELFTGSEYLSHIRTFDTVIHSPGIAMTQPDIVAACAGKHITSPTNLFFSDNRSRTIGITGTKGKSTTSSLVAAILSSKYSDVRCVGNIGSPMLDALEGANRETIFVLELSSFQLEDLRSSPEVAILLDIVPEHLDHHGTFEAYAHAKGNITRYQRPADAVILNPRNETLRSIIEGTKARKVYYSSIPDVGALVFCERGSISIHTSHGNKQVVGLDLLPLRGPGNIQNVLAAVACALQFDIPLDSIAKAIDGFKPLEHRLEFIGEWKHIRFYNDSLSTIPEALMNALEALSPDVETVIAGGYDRGLEYSALGPILSRSQVKTLILFPGTREKIWESVRTNGNPSNIVRIDAANMEEAVQAAFQSTAAGKICVLSPASSSFNMFVDYRDRGAQFKNCVRMFGLNP